MDKKTQRVKKSTVRALVSASTRSRFHGLGGGFSSTSRTSHTNKQLHYDPEKEADEAYRASLKHKDLKYFSMYRYATWKEIVFMGIGILMAASYAFFHPWLIYEFATWIEATTDELLCNPRIANWTDLTDASFCNITNHVTISPDFTTYYKVQMGFLMVAIFLSSFLSMFIFAITAENQISRIRSAYFDSILRKDMSWLDYYAHRDFGRHMTEDVTEIRHAIGERVPYLVYNIVLIPILVTICLVINWILTLAVGGILIPTMSAGGYLSLYFEKKQVEVENEAASRAESYAEKVFCHVKTVKYLNAIETEVSRFSSYLQKTSKIKIYLIFTSISIWALWAIYYICQALALYLGRILVIYEDYKTACAHLCNREFVALHLDFFDEPLDASGAVFIIIWSISQTCLSLGEVLTILNVISETKNTAADVFFMIDWKPRIDNLSTDGECPSTRAIGKIQMENVYFRYPRRMHVNVLNGINLTIHPNQLVAILGDTLSGKSTILRLIRRLYDPTEGNVFFDGRVLPSINVGWLRSQFGSVVQNPIFFNKSIEDNLKFANSKTTIFDIVEACRNIGIHDEINKLPEQYKTIVGHHGKKLQPSQRRRLAIAHACLQKPKVFLLDEPLLDCEKASESVLLELINHLRQNSTIVITSAEINSIVRQSDRIYVLDQGSILEQGNHDTLMELNGLYSMIERGKTRGLDPGKQVLKLVSQLKSYAFAKYLKKMKEKEQRGEIEAAAPDQNKTRRSISWKDFVDPIVGDAILFERDVEDTEVRMDNINILQKRDRGNLKWVSGGYNSYHYARRNIEPYILNDDGSRGVQREKRRHDPSGVAVSVLHQEVKNAQELSLKNAGSIGKKRMHSLTGSGRSNTSSGGDQSQGSRRASPAGNTIDSGRRLSSPVGILTNWKRKKSMTSSTGSGRDKAKGVFSSGNKLSITSSQRLRSIFIRSKDTLREDPSSIIMKVGEDDDDNADVRSIQSEEHAAFWDEYETVLESLEDDTVGENINDSWWDLFVGIKLGLLPVFGVAVVTSALLGFLSAFGHSLVAKFYEGIYSHQNFLGDSNLSYNNLMLILSGIFSGFIGIIQNITFVLGGILLTNHFKGVLFRKMLQMDLEWFDQPLNDISILCHRLTIDTAAIQNAVLILVGLLCQSIFGFLSSIFIAIYYAPESDDLLHLLVIIAGLSIIYVILLYLDGTFQVRFDSKLNKILTPLETIEWEVVSNLRTVITMGLEEHFMANYNGKLLSVKSRIFWLNVYRSILYGLCRSFPVIFYLIIGLYALEDPSKRESKDYVFDLILMTELFIQFQIRLGTNSAMLPDTEETRKAGARIKEFLSIKSNVSDPEETDPTDFEDPPGITILKLYHDSYGHIISLRDISFSIESKQFLAIVGSGAQSGMSLLINVMARFYRQSTGFIFLNKVDIWSIPLEKYHRMVGFIEDTPHISSLTFRENIAYGDSAEGFTDEEIFRAAQEVEIHDFIMALPKGYDTKLSALVDKEAVQGVLQRLSFARALLRNPLVLLIDGTFNAINEIEDDTLKCVINNSCEGRTSILVTERISLAEKADLILVLENGEIVEKGTHDSLLMNKKLYYQMYLNQKKLIKLSSRLEINQNDGTSSGNKASVAYNKYVRRRMFSHLPRALKSASGPSSAQTTRKVS